MTFYLISDNVDTLVGMRLIGIDGVVVHQKNEFLNTLKTAMDNPSIGVILVTTKLIELAPDIISEHKLTKSRQIILEIPDRHMTTDIGAAIDTYVSEAIGIKL
ncbi:MAG: V-type ATP synthase subunit F [Acholeplasmataceae bacterium]